MSVSRGSPSRGWLRWAAIALAVFAACLNPQPDDNPLDHPADPEGTVANQGDTDVKAPPPASMPNDQLEVPQSTPPAPQAGSSGGGADAGAPPPDEPDGSPGDGNPTDGNPGDTLESDAGVAD